MFYVLCMLIWTMIFFLSFFCFFLSDPVYIFTIKNFKINAYVFVGVLALIIVIVMYFMI